MPHLFKKLIEMEIDALRRSIGFGNPTLKAEALGEANGYRKARALITPTPRGKGKERA